MVTIKTTKEIRLEDFTGVLLVEEIERYWGYKWALVEEQKQEWFKFRDIIENERILTPKTYKEFDKIEKVLFGDE